MQRTFRPRRIDPSPSQKELSAREATRVSVFPLVVVIRRISGDESFSRIFTRRESSRNRAIEESTFIRVCVRFVLPRSLVLTRACRKKKSLGESFSRRQRVKRDKDRAEIRSGARNPPLLLPCFRECRREKRRLFSSSVYACARVRVFMFTRE